MNDVATKMGMNAILKVCSFLLSPLLCFFIILPSLKNKISQILLYCIFLVVGYSFSMPRERTVENNLDCITYRVDFENYVDVNTYQFLENIESYFTFSGKSDFYADSIFYTVSRFTTNYHYMFLVVAMIYAFFVIKLLNFFVQNKNYTFYSIGCLILLYLFSINQIFHINAFRFFTALIISLYSIFQICINQNKKYLILLFISPFFHGSFILIYVIALFVYLVRFNRKSATILLFVSFFSSFIFLSFIDLLQGILQILPDSLYNKYHYYLGMDYIFKINDGGSGFIWLKRLFEDVYLFILNLAVYKLLRNIHLMSDTNKLLFKWLLVSLIFVNVTIMIPSVGSRFVSLITPLFAYLWLDLTFWIKYKYFTYLIGSLLSLIILMPFPVFSFPCIFYYSFVLNYDFFLSPLYTMFKYLVFY